MLIALGDNYYVGPVVSFDERMKRSLSLIRKAIIRV